MQRSFVVVVVFSFPFFQCDEEMSQKEFFLQPKSTESKICLNFYAKDLCVAVAFCVYFVFVYPRFDSRFLMIFDSFVRSN